MPHWSISLIVPADVVIQATGRRKFSCDYWKSLSRINDRSASVDHENIKKENYHA
jgi:hypothetical protein